MVLLLTVHSFNLAFDRIFESFVWTTGLNKLRFWACICSSHGSIWCWTKFPVLCRSCFTSTFTALWLQKELVLQAGGQPSLDSPFWEQEKHSWAFWSIFWRIFTSWLHPGWRLLRCSGLEFILFLDLASHLVGLDLRGRGKHYISPVPSYPHSKGLVPVTKLSNSSPCVHVAKALNLLG